MLFEISGLIHDHSAVFLPADPPRRGRIALWRTAGTPPGAPAGARAGVPAGVPAGAPADADAGAPSHGGGLEELTVISPDLRRSTVVAHILSVDEALPLLTRARSAATGAGPGGPTDGTDGTGDSATAFWGAAALLALRFAARGQLLPGLSPAGHDAWRIGPLEAADLDEVRELAAAMPPAARCVPLNADGPPRLPSPEPLLRAFLDAIADALPRSPAAPAAAGGPAYADRPPQLHPELRGWAAEVAAGHDAGVRISLRIELDRALDRVLAVQVHRIIAEGTVEDRIAELLARKRALADAVLAGGEGALTELTDAELAELVALRPAARGE
ncbi:hypothetical protein [Streptomyces sp. NBC_01439]|uniref:hypothetical protein n=1 Tax=Streptomyces sp. NBC_01439 TaxID=2903867 RepID=UPI002E29F14E|nr:hypothetical protein [Streptomyces sp. NBC_01439]